MKNPPKYKNYSYAVSWRKNRERDDIIQQVFCSCPFPIIITNLEGIVINSNDAVTDLLGYSNQELRSNNIFKYFFPPFLDKNAGLVTTIAKKMQVENQQIQFLHKSGERISFIVTITQLKNTPERDGCETVLAWYIDGNKKTAESLNESEYKLQVILDNAEEAFMLVDINGVIKAFNRKAQHYASLILNNDQIECGQTVFEYISDECISKFEKIIYSVAAGETVRKTNSVKTIDGNTHWFQFSFSPVKDSKTIAGICITGNDITQRKATEEAAEKNEKRFTHLVENSREGMAILSPDGTVHYVSRAIYNALGYYEDEVPHINLFSLIHPDDVSRVKRRWKKILEKPGTPFKGVICRVLHKDGSWKWFDSTLTNMLHDSAIGGIINNFRDVTEKMNDEQRIRSSEERYKHLFYSNPVPMWIYDPQTLKFLEVNNAAILKYGYDRKEFLQLTIKDIREKEEQDRLVELLHSPREKPYSKTGTWRHKTRDGRQLWVEIASHIVQFGQREAILVLASDVTEKEEAQQLLRKAYQENNNILESITDGFFAVDGNWIVTYWNKEAERMIGIERADILGKSLWKIFDKKETLKYYEEYHRALREKIPVHFEEYFVLLDMWTEVSAFPSGDGLSIYFKDITERKLSDDKIRIANERYSLVTKATHDLIWDWDLLTDKVYRDEQAVKVVYGVDIHSIQSIEEWNNRIHPEDADQLFDVMEQIKKSVREDFFQLEYRFRSESGTYKDIYDRIHVVRNKQLVPVRIIGAAQDITEKRKLEQALRESKQRQHRIVTSATIKGQEKEREQLGLELHDNINQILATSVLYLDCTIASPTIKKDMIMKGRELIVNATQEIRKLSHALLPPGLDEMGLLKTLDELLRPISATGQLTVINKWETFPGHVLNRDQQLTIYRIVQEQLNNILKHAEAKTVTISLTLLKGKSFAQLEIVDDGKGFDTSQTRKGVGLRNIRSRAELFDGVVTISSKPGEGCRLEIIFPLNESIMSLTA